MEISHSQKLAWANKIAKGFNTTDVALEFGLLTAEVGEAFTAWRKNLPDLGEELADIVIYTLALAEMTGLDLDSEVERKIIKTAPASTPATPAVSPSASARPPYRHQIQQLLTTAGDPAP